MSTKTQNNTTDETDIMLSDRIVTCDMQKYNSDWDSITDIPVRQFNELGNDKITIYYYIDDNQIRTEYDRDFLLNHMKLRTVEDETYGLVSQLPIIRWIFCRNLSILERESGYSTFFFVEKQTVGSKIFGELCCYNDEQISKYNNPGFRMCLPCDGCQWHKLSKEAVDYNDKCFCSVLIECGNCPICICYQNSCKCPGGYCSECDNYGEACECSED
jgi:hypothetical protein